MSKGPGLLKKRRVRPTHFTEAQNDSSNNRVGNVFVKRVGLIPLVSLDFAQHLWHITGQEKGDILYFCSFREHEGMRGLESLSWPNGRWAGSKIRKGEKVLL